MICVLHALAFLFLLMYFIYSIVHCSECVDLLMSAEICWSSPSVDRDRHQSPSISVPINIPCTAHAWDHRELDDLNNTDQSGSNHSLLVIFLLLALFYSQEHMPASSVWLLREAESFALHCIVAVMWFFFLVPAVLFFSTAQRNVLVWTAFIGNHLIFFF